MLFLLVYSPAGGPSIPPTSGFFYFGSMPEKCSLFLVLSWCAVVHAGAASFGMPTIQAVYQHAGASCMLLMLSLSPLPSANRWSSEDWLFVKKPVSLVMSKGGI